MPRHWFGKRTIRPHLVPATLTVEPPPKPSQSLFELALLHAGERCRPGRDTVALGDTPREMLPSRAVAPRPVSIEEAIDQEFGAYWLGDEIPSFSEEFVAEILPIWARQSADRLRHAVGESEVENLRTFLETLVQNPRHPLIEQISYGSQISWTRSDTWLHFVRILQIIRAELLQR